MSKPNGWTPSAANDPNLRWELLPAGGIGRLLDIGPFDVNDGLERLRRGDRCYTVSIDGRLAHYSWVQRSGSHPITEAGVRVAVARGEFFIYHCRTVEWARGKGIYPATLVRIVNDYYEEGCSSAWIYTTRENIASQRGILRAGFNLVARLEAVRLGSHYFRVGRADFERFRASTCP